MFLVNCNGAGPWLTDCNVCIPAELARYTTMIYNFIKVIVPIALVLIGMFDMAKAVTTKSEDEVKKAQQLLVKKAIAGALVFVLFSAIAWILSIIDSTGNGNEGESVLKCMGALFDYHESTKTEEGHLGYTDSSSICVTNGYNGVLKIHDEKAVSNYYYVCYNYNKNDSKCEDSANGTKYRLSDGNDYCITLIDSGENEFAVIHGENNPNTCDTQNTQADCQICCENIGYKTGYLLSDNNKCLCAKKK